MFRAVFAAGTPSAVVLGVIAAVFSVVAFFYYAAVARQMWFHEPADLGEVASTARTPVALERRARAHHDRRGRGRRVPAALRPHRRPRLPARLSDPMGLETRIRERIHREGAISFAEFMELALYEPDGGLLHAGRWRGPRRA